jgi:hypothetical protein
MSDNASDRELILGNKQLLAIFFVAALLCGVFFAVGYVVGGNSALPDGAVAEDSSAPPVMEGKRDQPAATTPGSMAAYGSAASGSSAMPPAPASRMSDNPAAAGSAPPQTAQTAHEASSAPLSSAPAALSIPERGASYVQIAAQRRPAADDLANSLRERGWPTILAQSSKPELVQVLVGPYRAPLALADAKRKLTALGFAGLIVHKEK